ncbi:MAG: amino acid adenylation domain-containing protein [Oligoflexus sp.]
MATQREKIVRFGQSNHLVGIYSSARQGEEKRPTIVTWNTGISNRSGPYRIFTDLARRYQKQGYAVLRFDLSSLGDSDNRTDESQGQERSTKDIQDALNFLAETFDAQSFILIGICSGAVDAHFAAVADARVVGLCMVDTYVYRTKKFYYHYYRRRVWNPRRWKRFAHRQLNKTLDDNDDQFEGVYPSRQHAAQGLRALVTRQVPILVIFTGGFDYLYSYPEQFLDMFHDVNFNGLLTIEHHDRADHLFMLLETRHKFFASLDQWLPSIANEAYQQIDQGKDEVHLCHLIAEWEAKYQHETAVVWMDQSLSYRQLKQRSDRIASILAEHGVQAGQAIGICIPRCLELVELIIGILKVGACYVPLDPTYPTERLRYLISNSKPQIILTTEALAQQIISEATPASVLLMERDIQVLFDQAGESGWTMPSLSSDSPAYIIYTSGSTGKPKGVEMPHSALANLIRWQQRSYENRLKTLQFAPISFDVSFQEIFSTLLEGGSLVLIDDKRRIDPKILLQFLQEEKIGRIFLPYIALHYLAEAAQRHQIYPASLKAVFTAGEQLKVTASIRQFFKHLPEARLYNHYGPSETHVVTAFTLGQDPDSWPELPAIGKALPGCEFTIVQGEWDEVNDSEIGELLVGGCCLANGYIGLPQETGERFVHHPETQKRYYRTGDLVRFLPSGELEFLGRRDQQIKIRGHRIEPAEVELAISRHAKGQETVVDAIAELGGDRQLVCFILKSDHEFQEQALRSSLSQELPAYMIPEIWVAVEDFPRTPSGKIDRKKLVQSYQQTPDKPETSWQQTDLNSSSLSRIFAQILKRPSFQEDDHFFEKGGHSLLAIQLVNAVQEQFQLELSVLDIFEAPSPKKLLHLLRDKNNVVSQQSSAITSQSTRLQKSDKTPSQDIAIIGMAGRFPGADSLDELWTLLCQGQETATHFAADDLHFSIPDELKKDPDYIAVRGILSRYANFDAAFFRIPASEADIIDPQQRLLLELAWHALDDAGYPAPEIQVSTGVFAGVGHNTYYLENIMTQAATRARVGDFQAMIANDKDYVATRIAYKLNLTGPALSTHTACSTSLVTVIQAVQSLRNGGCDLALAGGAAISSPVQSGYLYQDGSIFAKDGHCRPFDRDASGTYFSDGGGLVVLKRLDDALRDHDRIYAVIRGVGLNNDGGDKASFSSPSVIGQELAIQAALADASLSPEEDISYVECHGTATPIGDPIEVEALKRSFRARRQAEKSCGLGSIKSNFGHLTAGAGVAGLIKVALCCYHKTLVPSINFQTPNPALPLKDSPFYILNRLQSWQQKQRIAGLSSFGIGGTNAHMIIAEFEEQAHEKSESNGPFTLCLSAHNEEALQRMQRDLDQFLKMRSPNLTDLSYTLQQRRHQFPVRSYRIIGKTDDETHPWSAARQIAQSTHIGFLFPGQGSQFLGMAQGWHQFSAEFRRDFDRCLDWIEGFLDIRLRPYLLDEAAPQGDHLQQTLYAQPAIFCYQYAAGKALLDWGITPEFFLGHSIGEIAAACLSGVMAEESALELVCQRARLMQELPSGAMIQVRASMASLENILGESLPIAAINGDESIVLAGSHEQIHSMKMKLDAADISLRDLATSHAFHSPMMQPMLEAFKQAISHLHFQKPKIPIYSTVTARIIDANSGPLMDADYWTKHAGQTVLFADTVRETLTQYSSKGLTFLEIGPGKIASTLCQRLIQKRDLHASCSLSLADIPCSAQQAHILMGLASLWQRGYSVPWPMIPGHEGRLISLPNYSFSSDIHWLEPEDNQSNIKQEKLKTSLAMPVANPDKGVENLSSDIKDTVFQRLRILLSEVCGLDQNAILPTASFYDLGLDSLFLTQLANGLKKEFEIPISFRQLSSDLTQIEDLVSYLADEVPTSWQEKWITQTSTIKVDQIDVSDGQSASIDSQKTDVQAIVQQQLHIMEQQLRLLQGIPAESNQLPQKQMVTPSKQASSLGTVDQTKKSGSHGPQLKIRKQEVDLSPQSENAFHQFIDKYQEKTKSSKQQVQQYRSVLADPRTVNGFRPKFKEAIYPLVISKAQGAYLWDLDGHPYIDLLCGYGSNLFGYQADFITEELQKGMSEGYAIGPQYHLVGECSALASQVLGHERVAWCNTGSEAVLAALRMARTVTGKNKIVIFRGAYHGLFDEVIAMPRADGLAMPAAPGVNPSSVENLLILEYGMPESLEMIRKHSHELAAVLLEPVQSRNPDFVPLEFLQELRKLTQELDLVLIMDEVITGFRCHPQGFQGWSGIKGDLACYGKILGGGLPIGLVAGRSELMDALDGGFWQFGDQSQPEAGVTYFAGTFVRHPLAVRTAFASLQHLQKEGTKLQESLSKNCENLVHQANQLFQERGLALHIEHFASQMFFTDQSELSSHYPELLSQWLRYHGVHFTWGFPSFITTAHSQADLNQVLKSLASSLDEMLAAGLLQSSKTSSSATEGVTTQKVFLTEHGWIEKPDPQARLGIDEHGQPAWYKSTGADGKQFLKLTKN